MGILGYDQYTGRREILTDTDVITRENVVKVLSDALTVHFINRSQIEYLYDYYKGKQPVLERVKQVRPELNNTIVENIANQIVTFKVGYNHGEPVMYVGRGDTDCNDRIAQLNEYMAYNDKPSSDVDVVTWSHIAGVGYRMAIPEPDMYAESPFRIFSLDPRSSFVVRHNWLGKKPVMGVMYVSAVINGATKDIYSVYTKDRYYEIIDGEIVKDEANVIGVIPIVEYPLNSPRLGVFEPVLPLLDAINELASNRLDAVQEFVQAYMLFHNVDVNSDELKAFRELGAVVFQDAAPDKKGEVKYITAELNQSQVQTLKDDLKEAVLSIVGMPNRSGGASTSDTGTAVVYRDGWSDAEARAKDAEKFFQHSEREFLAVVLAICRDTGTLDLHLSHVDIKFTRRNYENIASKATVLTQLMAVLPPRQAYIQSGLFTDPEAAYAEYVEWKAEQEAKALAIAETNAPDQEEEADDGNQADTGSYPTD